MVGNDISRELCHHSLEIGCDQVETLNSELKLSQGLFDSQEQVVVTRHLLDKNDVERVRISSQFVLQLADID